MKLGKSKQLTAVVEATSGYSYERERRNRSKMLVKFLEASVAGASSLEKRVSLNSNEVEYVAINEAVKMIVWLKGFLA